MVSYSKFSSSLTCDACKILVKGLDDLIQSNLTEAEIVDIATVVCIAAKIESERVCRYGVREFKDEVFGVLVGHYASPDQICGSILGDSCAVPYDPNSDWNITLLNTTKPPVVVPKPPKSGSPVVKIVQLSDIHYDRMYLEGSNAECGEPICCRSNDGQPAPGVPGAGKWGDHRGCDAPLRLIENLLQHLAKNQEFHIIYLTGDFPAHDVWNQTRNDQISVLKDITNLLLKYLPTVKVYPALGNHEGVPVNAFPPPYVTGKNSGEWLYQTMVTEWISSAKWLPSDAQDDIMRGGYYSTLAMPGLRVVSLNMNMCGKGNWWLYINETDPAGQLQWLINVLQKAEDNKEKVHILGHIPPGGTCLKAWSWNYYRIVNRYENTITGQFFGHKHKDTFEIFYDEKTMSRPLSVDYIAGSVTPNGQVNPSYRVYEVDGNYTGTSWLQMILDHQTYILYITEANLTDKPVWKLEYSAKMAYGMSSLLPSEWNNVVNKLENDNALFQKYYQYYFKSYVTSACDTKCKAKMICSLKKGRSHDKTLCDEEEYGLQYMVC
ncbi:sphingomyelin phosphodiesterase-like [Amphiura filiformis]|uniref:sphingomyelin phosphodiesterase-like n=1 Tax=Amphiura filiformis TaxID=82378 RepID=UPI003B221B5B